LFALAIDIHPLISSIQAKFLNLKHVYVHAWFLDDGTVVGAATEVALVLEAVVSEGPDFGIFLNPSKTKFSFSVVADRGPSARLVPPSWGGCL
jgi:hypothetical protein